MAKNRPQQTQQDYERELQTQIARKASRRLRAQQEQERGIMFWLGMFGLVGWSVAIPTLLGTAMGVWADSHWPGEISWTLTLLFVGTLLGCLHAWYWIREENKHD